MAMIRPIHQQYIVKGGGSLPDPSTYCPTNGYIDPTQPNDDWLILPKANINNGLLYTLPVVTDSRNIAPEGWRVPQMMNDYFATITALGGASVAGGKLKEMGLDWWNTPNTGATNEYGFNAKGSGYRIPAGTFGSSKFNLRLWVNYIEYPSTYSIIELINSSTSVGFNEGSVNSGNSIRLVKITTSLSNGASGFMVGNDGKVYRTICILGKEYMAENLAETKYRDGSAIPEVTDNTSWAALTTGALCAYENNWSNV